MVLVFALGAFALAAQTLLFREFFTVYEGNELGMAAFFFSWLLWVGIGALLSRCVDDRSRWVRGGFDYAVLIYLPAFLLQSYLVGQSRPWAGVDAYELFPFARMFPLSLLVNAPVSLCTGLLFALACRRLAVADQPVARVYIVEAAGACAAGLAVTLALQHSVTAQTLFLYAALLLCGAVFLARLGSRDFVWPLLPILLIAATLAAGWDARWTRAEDRRAWSRRLPAEGFEGAFATPQARYLYGRYGDQFNVVSWQTLTDRLP